jgi:hypothetical protein
VGKEGLKARGDNPEKKAPNNEHFLTSFFSPAFAVVPEKIEGMPLTDVRLVNIKLITLSELKLITELGAEGRRKLAELFEGPQRLVSSLTREAVL